MKIRMGDFPKMRLYNVYYLCKQCEAGIDGLNIQEKRSGIYKIDQWNAYKEVLFTIRNIPFLRENVNDFYKTIPVFVREEVTPEIDSSTRNSLFSKKNAILSKMRTVIELYESMNLNEKDNGIDVKIPPCNSLQEYISYLKEIDFVFSQCPFLQHKDGEIKFNTVDVGSQWITFLIAGAVGTTAVTYILNNVAMLVSKAINLKSRLNNLEEQKEIIRTKKLQNDTIESSIEMLDTLKRHYISGTVEEMQNEDPECKLKDGEEIGKAEKSLEKLCALLDKGVEIYASIDTEKEIQVLFPEMEDTVELPDGIIKYIESKIG